MARGNHQYVALQADVHTANRRDAADVCTATMSQNARNTDRKAHNLDAQMPASELLTRQHVVGAAWCSIGAYIGATAGRKDGSHASRSRRERQVKPKQRPNSSKQHSHT